MNDNQCKLIIVEGLSGSGKSIMAHFIARQLQHNRIDADWVHEGEVPHPVSMEVESSIESYMAAMLEKWTAFVERLRPSSQVTVIEAHAFDLLWLDGEDLKDKPIFERKQIWLESSQPTNSMKGVLL